MSNTIRPLAKKISRVLYFHNNKVVRVVVPGQINSTVRHHQSGHFIVPNTELFIATKDECKAYLAPVK